MNHNVQKLFLSMAVAVSLIITISPSYAKDEADKATTTSKVEKSKKDKSEKDTEKKSTSKGDKDSAKKSTKNSDDKAEGSEKEIKKGAKDKPEKSNNSTSEKTNKDSGSSAKKSVKDSTTASKSVEKSKSKQGTTVSTAKKQFKNITVNLNKADANTFSHYLMGIGAVKAKAIVAYRSKNGKFKDANELLKVEGIGEKVFAGLKKNVSLTTGETSAPKASQATTNKAK